MQDLYLGIDLGGTHLSLGLYNRSGNALQLAVEEKFREEVNNENLVQKLIYYIKLKSSSLPKDSRVAGLGLGSPGPLDPITGVIKTPPNLKVVNLPIIEILRKNFPKIPVIVLINDSDAAVLAEHWLGAGKGFSDVVMVTLGTGVGSGVITDHKLQRGLGMASEWGHIPIVTDDEPRICGCGWKGCLEAYVGMYGLVRTFCEIFNFDLKQVTPEKAYQISFLMRRGLQDKNDQWPQWHEVFRKYCNHLIKGILNIVMAHQPNCIILGGGIISKNEELFDRLACNLKIELNRENHKMAHLCKDVLVVPAKLDNSGALGAAKHAIDCYDKLIAKRGLDHGLIL